MTTEVSLGKAVHLVVIIGVLLAGPTMWQAPGGITDAQVADALAIGVALRADSVVVDKQTGIRGHFRVQLYGPIGRISLAAQEAKRASKPLQVSDVTPAMRALSWTVSVVPLPPRPTEQHGDDTAPLAAHVTLVPANGPSGGAVAPIREQLIPFVFGDTAGQGILATFDPAQVPERDFDIAIAAQSVGYFPAASRESVTIDAHDRAKIR